VTREGFEASFVTARQPAISEFPHFSTQGELVNPNQLKLWMCRRLLLPFRHQATRQIIAPTARLFLAFYNKACVYCLTQWATGPTRSPESCTGFLPATGR
jgi:hypothetical protein